MAGDRRRVGGGSTLGFVGVLAVTLGTFFALPRGWSPPEDAGAAYTLLLEEGAPRAAPPSRRSAQVPAVLAHQVDADGVPQLLLEAPSRLAAGAVEEIRLALGGAEGATPAFLPDGWSSVLEEGALVLRGPALSAERLFARFELPAVPTLESVGLDLRGAQGALLGLVVPLETLPPFAVLDALEDVLHFPWQITPGEQVEFEIVDAALTRAEGLWSVAGATPTPLAPSANGNARYAVRLPPGLTPGTGVGITWTNPWGQVAVAIPRAPVQLGSAPASPGSVPRLTGCAPMGFEGRAICICGWFPDRASREGLLLDGQPLGPPLAASATSVVVRIPSGTAPGPHTVSGAPASGFAPGETATVTVLSVRGQVDQSRLALGEVTPLTLEVLGTDLPLQIVLTNRSATVVQVTGGARQVLTTSGGASNRVVRDVQGIAPGAFTLHYKLSGDPCPCSSRPGVLVAGGDPPPTAPPGGTRPRPPLPDSTTVGPPTFPEAPDTLPVPAPPDPPTSTPPEDRSEESCCGFDSTRTVLTYPRIEDFLTPSDPETAPRTPAIGASQVLLGSGAYFHNELDLQLEAVGLPTEVTRHYKGDVRTAEGGLLGHGWDLGVLKRIVPIGPADAGDGLLEEVRGRDRAALWFHNGQGRSERYDEAESEWRDVLNFAQARPFHAFVTTYRSPPGAFHEIQRYVLADPAEHPFIDHPNVDATHREAVFFVLRERNGTRYVFNCRGQLLHVLHRNDVMSLAGAGLAQPADSLRWTLYHLGPLNPLLQNTSLSQIVDTRGEVIELTWRPIGTATLDTNIECVPRHETLPIPRLDTVRAAGLRVELEYGRAADGSPLLTSATLRPDDSSLLSPARSEVTRYTYDGAGRLETVTDPESYLRGGPPFVRNRYDGLGRVVAQELGGGLLSFQVGYPSPTERVVTDRAGNRTRYSLVQQGAFQVVAEETIIPDDPTWGGPWSTRYSHNAATQITAIETPNGARIDFTYDSTNEPVTLGSIRNRPGVTYLNDLSEGNLLEVARHAPGAGGNAPALVTRNGYEPLFNQVMLQVDGRGNATRYAYRYDRVGELGNPVEIKLPDLDRPDGSSVTVAPTVLAYNPRGQKVTSTDPAGRTTGYTYQGGPPFLLERIAYPSGGERTFERDGTGRVVREGGSFGVTDLELDWRGRLAAEIRGADDPAGLGNRTEYAYTATGLVRETRIEVKDNFGPGGGGPAPATPAVLTLRVEHDALGRVVRETRSDGQTRVDVETVFDRSGNVETVTMPGPGGPRTTDRIYDARGNVVQEIHAQGTAAERIVEHVYDANGNVIRTRTSGSGGSTEERFEYDGFDRLVASIGASGTEHRMTLDADGNPTRETWTGDDGTGARRVLRQAEHTFDAHAVHVATRAVDPVSSEAQRSWLLRGPGLDLERSRGPAGGEVSYAHDSGGRVVRVTTPVGDTTFTVWDEADRIVAVTEVEIERVWDATAASFRSQAGRYAASFEYDGLGRMIRETRGSAEARYFYNSLDLRRGTSADGVLESVTWDAFGRRIRRSVGGRSESWILAATGEVLEHRTPDAHLRWSYDALGQPLTRTSVPTGATARWTWDGLGNAVEAVDENGTVVRSAFDASGRVLEERVVPGGVVVQVGARRIPAVVAPPLLRFRYDGLGQLVEASSGDVVTRWRHDGFGRLVSETQSVDGRAHTFTHRWGPENASLETTYPEAAGGTVVRRDFDRLGREVRIGADGHALVHYEYSGASRIAGRTYGNGIRARYGFDGDRRGTEALLASSLGLGQERTVWTERWLPGRHGPLEVVRTLHGDAGAGRVDRTVFDYDGNGDNVTVRTDSRTLAGATQTAQTEDVLHTAFQQGRPVEVAEAVRDEQAGRTLLLRLDRFTRDPQGRVSALEARVGTRFPTDPGLPADVAAVAQELSSAPEVLAGRQAYHYDDVGNLIADGRLAYAYDHEGRLTRVEELDRAGLVEALLFQYDAAGRRVRAIPTAQGGSSMVTWEPWAREQVVFLYDGPNVVAEIERDRPGAPAETLLARYVIGTREGERVSMERWEADGSHAFWFLHEGLDGSVRLLSDEAARTAEAGFRGPGAGSPFGRPDDLHFVDGTDVRSPYLTGGLRVDGFAGVRHDEMTGRLAVDYRTLDAFADSAAVRSVRQGVEDAQRTGVLMLAGSTGLALGGGVFASAIPAMWSSLTWSGVAVGAFAGAGLSATTSAVWANHTEATDYDTGDFLLAAAEGAVFGAIGGAMARAELALAEELAAGYAADLALGTLADVTLRDRSLGTALAGNVVGASVGALFGAGVAAGLRGAESLAMDLTLRSLNRDAMPSVASGGPGDWRWGIATTSSGRAIQFTEGARSARQKAFEMGMLRVLETGTTAGRVVAWAIRSGRLKVRVTAFVGDLSDARGLFSRTHPNTVWINADYVLGLKENTGVRLAAGVLLHEGIHALGGGEIAAHVAQARFLARLLDNQGGQAGGGLLLRPADHQMVAAWRKGQATGRFPELIDYMTRRGYGSRFRMGSSQPRPKLRGFSKLLGVDGRWAQGQVIRFDGRGLTGHWE